MKGVVIAVALAVAWRLVVKVFRRRARGGWRVFGMRCGWVRHSTFFILHSTLGRQAVRCGWWRECAKIPVEKTLAKAGAGSLIARPFFA